MNARDYIRNLRARLEALEAARPAETLRITLDLVALVKLRVQTRGENFRETPFAPYTSGYARQRAKAGYQVGYVDFTRTGRLWASVRPEVVKNEPGRTLIQVTARTADDQDKLRGARRKRGNILLPSEKEIEIARRSNRERIRKHLKI